LGAIVGDLDKIAQTPQTTRFPLGTSGVKLLVLHGPNLNLLGEREPAVYGYTRLSDIDQRLAATAEGRGWTLRSFQSNNELSLIEQVHAAKNDGTALIVLNPGAFTHTSVALRDALAAVAIPFIEVHLSNVYAREPFRHQSYFSGLALGVISGFGPQSYDLALEAAFARLEPHRGGDEIQTGI
jgi:3-dehydroquinate dehydratase-2